MKTLALLLVPLLAVTSHACGVVTHQAVVAQQFIVSSYAVPVGIPVANYAPYTYSTNAGYQDLSPVVNELRALRSEIRAGAMNPNLAAAKPQSLVAQNCASCHSGGAPKAGLDLSNLEALDDATRLKCVSQILQDKMPKNKPITDPVLAGKLLNELSSSPKVAAPPAQPPVAANPQ